VGVHVGRGTVLSKVTLRGLRSALRPNVVGIASVLVIVLLPTIIGQSPSAAGLRPMDRQRQQALSRVSLKPEQYYYTEVFYSAGIPGTVQTWVAANDRADR
jgi:hypothetical protein